MSNWIYHVCVSTNNGKRFTSFPISSPKVNTLEEYESFVEGVSEFMIDTYCVSDFAVISINPLHEEPI